MDPTGLLSSRQDSLEDMEENVDNPDGIELAGRLATPGADAADLSDADEPSDAFDGMPIDGSVEDLTQLDADTEPSGRVSFDSTLERGISLTEWDTPTPAAIINTPKPVPTFIQSQLPITHLRGQNVCDQLKYTSMVELLCDTEDTLLEDVDAGANGRPRLTHERFRRFVVEDQPGLLDCSIDPLSRVGLCLPNGPEFATALMLLMCRACACPINKQATAEEIEVELKSFRCSSVVIQVGDLHNASNAKVEQAAQNLNIHVIQIEALPEAVGLFKCVGLKTPSFILEPQPKAASLEAGKSDLDLSSGQWTNKHSVVLVLHTSGTTGTKKVVPYSAESLVVGAVCIAASWQLTPTDICCGMMPLFHVGGIARTVLAVFLSGSATICLPGFDPQLVWELIAAQRFTWYYAGPTMHHMLVEEAAAQAPEAQAAAASGAIRMIANAAGGLLPSLAVNLRKLFGSCTVLPGYGMTECMPISSPPVGYALERVGTSGLVCGPELAIMDERGRVCNPLTPGAICVRGPPLFQGYELAESNQDRDRFQGSRNDNGWFDTGDCGYLDKDGYLYITGRNKEIINRGGEVISPFEIEEVMGGFQKLAGVLAFSAPHPLLQETVGLAVVIADGFARPDMQELQTFAAEQLQPSKWPHVVVFMDVLPKSGTGKLLRIKLAERLDLPELPDDSPHLSRMFEATAPAPGTAISSKIPCTQVQIREWIVEQVLGSSAFVSDVKLVHWSVWTAAQKKLKKRRPHLKDQDPGDDSLVAYVSTSSSTDPRAMSARLHEALQDSPIHRYELPMSVVVIKKITDLRYLPSPASGMRSRLGENTPDGGNTRQLTKTETKVIAAWRKVLGKRANVADGSSDFFTLGGTSLEAGRLTAQLRTTFDLKSLAVDRVFVLRTVADMAHHIDEKLAEAKGKTGQNTTKPLNTPFPKPTPAQSATKPHVQLVQLAVFLFSPTKRSLIFFTFVCFFTAWQQVYGSKIGHRLPSLLLAVACTTVISSVFFPLLAILCKWLIIGRYREGRYPLWGHMYLRWWLCTRIYDVCGYGLFNMHPALFNLYLRLMGATIGENVRIAGPFKDWPIGEFDLVRIDDDVCVGSYTQIHPFALDHGAMTLSRIHLQRGSSVGDFSTIAAGTKVPADAHLPPASSGYQIELANPEYFDQNSAAVPAPDFLWKLFVAYPVVAAVEIVCKLPYLFILHLMVHEWEEIKFDRHSGVILVPKSFDAAAANATGMLGDPELFDEPAARHAAGIWNMTVTPVAIDYHLTYVDNTLAWFGTPFRLFFYFVARINSVIIEPFIYFALILVVKKLIIGTFEPGPLSQSNWQLTRHWLANRLMSNHALKDILELIGPHYEIRSKVYRLLGAKVGMNVFWPGVGPAFTGQWDLLDIGDNVTFGSRTGLQVTDRVESARICVHDGAMVGNNCFMSPGTILEKKVMFGTGSVSRKHFRYPAGSTWLGRENHAFELKTGNKVLSGATCTPFARAMSGSYKMPYYVLGPWQWFVIVISIQCFAACVKFLPLVLTLYLQTSDSETVATATSVQLNYNTNVTDAKASDATSTFDKAVETFFNATQLFGNATHGLGNLTVTAGDDGVVSFDQVAQAVVKNVTDVLHNAKATAHHNFHTAALDLGRPKNWKTFTVRSHLGAEYYLKFMGVYVLFSLIKNVFSIMWGIFVKWTVVGRRKVGDFHYDKSSYIQRWKLCLALQKLTGKGEQAGEVRTLGGSCFVVMYFRAAGARIGANVCLYPYGCSPMMTEPELVYIGSYCAIDDSSLVCHVNSYGELRLNTLKIGDNCTLRASSRMQTGAILCDGSQLLEGTVVLEGDTVAPRTVAQGWPLVRQWPASDGALPPNATNIVMGSKAPVGVPADPEQTSLLTGIKYKAGEWKTSLKSKIQRSRPKGKKGKKSRSKNSDDEDVEYGERKGVFSDDTVDEDGDTSNEESERDHLL